MHQNFHIIAHTSISLNIPRAHVTMKFKKILMSSHCIDSIAGTIHGTVTETVHGIIAATYLAMCILSFLSLMFN